MQYFLKAAVLAAFPVATIVAVEFITPIDRVAVPNGAFQLADYGGIVPGKTLQLTVKAPQNWTLVSADCSGGGDSMWKPLGVALFKAFIKPTFRGVHAGTFNGNMVPMVPMGPPGNKGAPPPPGYMEW